MARITTYKRKGVRRKSHNETHIQTLEVFPYQLSHLIKIMVVDRHSIFSHKLVGFSFYVADEGNKIFFRNSHHHYSKVGGVHFVHIDDRSVPLVEGVPAVNN